MLCKSLLIACAISAFGTAANAADLTGPYVGAGITHDNFQGTGGAQGFGMSGVGASIFGGYNAPVGPGFIGVEGNVDLNTAGVGGIKAKWGWGIGARAGLALTEGAAVYVRAGYQRNQIDFIGNKDWGGGLRLGGGIEASVSGTTSLRIEYGHVDFEGSIENNQVLAGVIFGF